MAHPSDEENSPTLAQRSLPRGSIVELILHYDAPRPLTDKNTSRSFLET